MYNLEKDPYCLKDLSGSVIYEAIQLELTESLEKELRKSRDPRVVGSDKEVFDSYKRYSRMRKFPKPENIEKRTINE